MPLASATWQSSRLLPAAVATFSQPWDRAVRPAWLIVGLSSAALAALCVATGFHYADAAVVLQRLLVVVALVIMSLHFRAKEWSRTALALEAMALSIAIVLSMPPLASILASAALPYQDDMLAGFDRALGLDWPAIAFWFREHPAVSVGLSHVYVSIEWQPALLIAALAFADPERLRHMISASTVALAVTIVSFMLVPATGPYPHFNFAAAQFPDVLAPGAWVAPGITEALRSGTTQTSFEGLVTFPSYHAVTSILFAYGWLAVPLVGRAFFAWNMAMLVSCVPIGGHYVVDVIAGVALALVSLHVSKQYFARTDRSEPLAHWTQTEEGRVLSAWMAEVPQRLRQRTVFG